MKKSLFILFLSPLLCFSSVSAQSDTDSTGYAGDNFSLQGALELFKESSTLEEFEKKINSEDSNVNNLDLNEDGETDYVKVIDLMDGDVHAFALQALLSKDESQDIAVIALEKTGKENAAIQIIGDEDVYGEETIVEPGEDEEYAPAQGKGGMPSNFSSARIVVNVWGWGCVKHVYRPGYRVWVSPWRWAFYPKYWKPWRPVAWRVHYYKRPKYHLTYRYHPTVRVVKAHKIYVPKRKTTVRVKTKTTTVRVAHNNSGTKVVKGKRTTTKVVKKNKDGKVVKGKKTTTTKKGVKKNEDGSTTKKGKKTTTTKKGKKNKDGTKKGKKTTKTTKVKKKKNG